MSEQETNPAPATETPPSALQKAVAIGFTTLLEIEKAPVIAHCRRVARWARELGALNMLSDADLDELEAAALLHDIGLLSSSITPLNLQSADKTVDEKTKRHPLLGFSVLSPIPGFERIATAILHHHERFDGSGYPKKLRGEEIPLFSRLIAVADLFDLESHPTGYTAPDIENVRKRILQERGRALDPDMANRFLFIVTTSDDLHRQDKKTVELPFSALKPGMVLARDLKSIDGKFLLRAGVSLTEAVLNKAFATANLEWLLTTAHVDSNSIRAEGG